MKKKITVLAMALGLGITITACGSSKKGETSETTMAETVVMVTETETESAEEAREAVIWGIWGVEELEAQGSKFSLAELEATGDYSLSNFYLVFKEGGAVYVSDSGNGRGGEWSLEEDNTLKVGSAEISYDPDRERISMVNNSAVLYMTKISEEQDLTKIPANKEMPAETETPTEPETTEPETAAARSEDEISPEFMEAMDAYEEFFDEYAAFMKKYTKSDNAISMMTDYLKYMEKYAEVMDEFEDWEDQDMTDAELKYYTEVQLRISQKLLEVY